MPERISQGTISESSHVKWSFIQQKTHLSLRPCSLDNTLNRPSSAWESFNVRTNLGLFVLGLTHIIFPQFVSNWCEWESGYSSLVSIFVKILFNFKKKNISLNKVKPKKSFNICQNKTKNFNWLATSLKKCHLKNLISPKPTWRSQWSLISSRNLKR